MKILWAIFLIALSELLGLHSSRRTKLNGIRRKNTDIINIVVIMSLGIALKGLLNMNNFYILKGFILFPNTDIWVMK